ncbi:SRPBCC domain-containing protein [Puteibacter caeruleilacunae]|nr:SRPBCC domain-containing protein [Puteibacter caeruleilacunae]
MAEKVKIKLEYVVKCSPKVLFNRLSTAAGLAEWFADDVNVKGKMYTFTWDKSSQEAEKVLQKEGKMVRYQWLDEDEGYFEFRINKDELTGDVSLIIVDLVDEDDQEDSKDLWNTQVADLKHIIGS